MMSQSLIQRADKAIEEAKKQTEEINLQIQQLNHTGCDYDPDNLQIRQRGHGYHFGGIQ